MVGTVVIGGGAAGIAAARELAAFESDFVRITLVGRHPRSASHGNWIHIHRR